MVRLLGVSVDFGVVHRIHDREGWSKALGNEDTFPSDFHLHSFVEAEDRHVALCVWEAPSREALQEVLDRFFGLSSRLSGRRVRSVRQCGRSCRWTRPASEFTSTRPAPGTMY
jgi:hypothetical protein